MRTFVHCLRLLLCLALVSSGPALPHAHAQSLDLAAEVTMATLTAAPAREDAPCHAQPPTDAGATDLVTVPERPSAQHDGEHDCCPQGQCHCAVMHPNGLAGAQFAFAPRIEHASPPTASVSTPLSIRLDEPQRPPIA